MNKTFSAFFFVLLFSVNLQAQPYYFRHYQVENGLSNNTINFIKQDSKGFMWFATKDGLNRFDGSQFKVFRMNTSVKDKNLSKDYIYCILAGENGMLWVGAQNGLYKFNPEKEALEIFIDSLPNVYDLTIDRQGKLWFLSSNMICRYDFVTKKIKVFPPSRYFNATSLCMSTTGNIWAASNQGFLKEYDPDTETFTGYDMFVNSKTPSSRYIQKIYGGANNSIYVGTAAQGLKVFDGNHFTYKDVLTYNPDRTTVFVRDILQNDTNEYWIATESGIFIYNSTTGQITNLKKKFQDPYSLNDNAIYSLFKDAEGSIWAGTFFGGINYYAKENAAFIKYFPDNSNNSIAGSSVREICGDQYNNLWIGSEDGGLSKINKKTSSIGTFKPTGEKTSIAYPNIHGLLAVGNDLWIGTFEHGIDIMNIRSGKIEKHFLAGNADGDIKSNFALCFYRTKSGMIIIGSGNGVYIYNDKNATFSRPEGLPGNLFATSILEDHRNIIWVGTINQGVYWFDPVTHDYGVLKNDPEKRNSLSNNSVNDVFEDALHNIWFCTEGGGLCKLSPDRKTFTTYTTSNGLPANFVFKILEDDSKTLWASTSKGLLNFDHNFNNIHVYTKSNGLLTDQFNYHSGYKDADGRLYFGSVKGMISFMPEDFTRRHFTPPVYLTGIQVFSKELSPDQDSSLLKKSIICADKIVLPYNQSSISIDFAALSYISPQMTAYKYKLDGLENSWTTIKTVRKVYFTNLSPGTYVFNVKASINETWNEKATQLIIEIKPPLWATWWAYCLYVILTGLLLYYFISTYNKRLHDKKIKEIYESKIEFFTNVAHEIRTPLTLIKGPVENLLELKDDIPDIKEDLECLDRNTNRLTDLVSQILDFRQTEIKKFMLDFTRVNLTETIKETALRFNIMANKSRLDYQVVVPEKDLYIMADQEALQKILSNLVNNAIKYADKLVTIRLFEIRKNDKGDDFAMIEFENDGYLITPDHQEKIFEPFYRIKETSHQKGTGIGLSLSRSLVELHQGTLYLRFVKKGVNVFRLILPVGTEKFNKLKIAEQPITQP
ncbi:MAG TPA: two-component regulator propeller domain-containing protein [Hanamia sp.]|nr:two-component regulator propeller domain-containing protein [Hanamia sp.]